MKKSKLYPWYFAAGAIIIYTTLCVIPGIIGIGYAFTDWSAYSKEIHFVGWENFKKLFSADTNYDLRKAMEVENIGDNGTPVGREDIWND